MPDGEGAYLISDDCAVSQLVASCEHADMSAGSTAGRVSVSSAYGWRECGGKWRETVPSCQRVHHCSALACPVKLMRNIYIYILDDHTRCIHGSGK